MVASPQAPLLTIDRGNTTLDCMLHGDDSRRQRLAPDSPGALQAFLGSRVPRAAIAVTVVPDGLSLAKRELAAIGVTLRVAGSDLPCPLQLDYRTPHSLGADRWLGALAAFRAQRRRAAVITVDCGSATTINLVSADGVFRGGAIAPGLQAMAAGMAARTPHLPQLNLEQAGEMPPRSSQAAVSAGVVVGWCGAIERLVGDLRAAAGEECPVVLTGGEATFYLRHGRLTCEHVPDLVHRGLLLLAAEACAS